ncbi:MAG: adenylosuccinate lyase family protein [Rhodobacteraceae bacterium]|nr:adenylosuccinate lyase family protein [Paracoccaceae bacterium]
MAASLFDSPNYAKLFPVGDAGRLFTDTAEVRAMMLVEGTLAILQGKAGTIPEISAQAIHRASLELQIDPAGLSDATGQNGVSVPGLVAEFRKLMQAPEHAQYLHFGATSQDITDTALMLRLRQLLGLQESALKSMIAHLRKLATDHAETPMVARTYGQSATLTSFGATVASWGHPLIDLLDEMENLRASTLWVSLAGAAGTASALGDDPTGLRAELAAALGLQDPKRNWHNDRSPIQRIAAWQTRLNQALGKFAQDILIHSQSTLKTVQIGATGGSSTMPQKENPVQASTIVALANQAVGLQTTLTLAAQHKEALTIANDISAAVSPNQTALSAQITATNEMIHAEALSFELAKTIPRPEAQAAVKQLCQEALATGSNLIALAQTQYPSIDAALFGSAHQMGTAPEQAHAFAERAKDAEIS